MQQSSNLRRERPKAPSMRPRSCGSAREVVAAVAVVVVEEAAGAAVEEAAGEALEELAVEEPAAAEEVRLHHFHLGPSQDPSHVRIPIHARTPIHAPIQNHVPTPNAPDPNRLLV